MTALTVPTAGPALLSTRYTAAPRSSFARQVGVEARKLVDTRAGLWLLIAGALLTVGVAALNTWIATEMVKQGAADLQFTWMFATGSVGSALNIFLALLGILTITSEWSQRTALTTFALEPRRGRVLLAKGVVLGAATLLSVALAAAVGAAVVAIVQGMGLTASWDLPLPELAGFTALALYNTAQGVAFGLLLLNTPAAIVAFFALPAIASMVSAIGFVWEPLAKVTPWVIPDQATGALANGTIAGQTWWHLLTATLIWIVAPAAVGTWRWLNRQAV